MIKNPLSAWKKKTTKKYDKSKEVRAVLPDDRTDHCVMKNIVKKYFLTIQEILFLRICNNDYGFCGLVYKLRVLLLY